VIVAFHRVDDRLQGNPISCTAGEFEAYCDFFQRYFELVTMGELLRRLELGESIARCLAITFDDGYRDNLEVAAPSLRARGMPACFFVATGLVGSTVRPWWDVEYGAQSRWMTWDDVRLLKVQGFEIGTHTVTHIDLGTTDPAVAREEIAASRKQLRSQGLTAHLFSYPYGRPHQISNANREMVRSSGLSCCLSGFGGTVRPGDDPFELKRMPINPWLLSPSHFGFEVLFRA
jgi:peptidoglycan/xylan/chitin deacetylase (PgdA/CDA1 family)